MSDQYIEIDFLLTPPKLLNPEYRNSISDGLFYHINEQIPLEKCVFQENTKGFNYLMNEANELHDKGIIELSEKDLFFIKNHRNSAFG